MYVSKATTRTVASSTVLIGTQATGIFETDELEFVKIPQESLYVGQAVTVVSGQQFGDIFTTTITSLNGLKATLADDLPTDGMYERGIRLVEFEQPSRNQIQWNRTGVKVGLYGIANGDLNGDTLTLDTDFTSWSSLKPNVTEVFIEGMGNDNPYTITDVLPKTRAIKVNNPLTGNVVDAHVRFSGADNFHMTSTSVTDSVDDGIVIGGGSGHQIGRSTNDLQVFADKLSAEDNVDPLTSPERVFELVSYGHRNISLVPVSAGAATSSTEEVKYLEFQVSAETGEWLLARIDSGVPVSEINVFGTGLPDGSDEAHEVAILAESPELDVDTGEYKVRITNTQNSVAFSDASIFFGTGTFIRVDPQRIVVGESVEGEGIYEFTTIDGVLNPTAAGGEAYVVLSTPSGGLIASGNGDSLPEVGKNIRFVNRTELANVLSYNAGFGISVVDATPGSEVYSDVINTWRIAGNYIDLSYDINFQSWRRYPNARGALNPSMFAKIFGQDKEFNSIQYSSFDRTDEYGNQYAEEKPISDSDSPSDGDDNPFGQDPTDGDGTGDGGDGDGDGGDGTGGGDETGPGVRPGVPF